MQEHAVIVLAYERFEGYYECLQCDQNLVEDGKAIWAMQLASFEMP
jgi:uncharacterized CHY-type Zn-finger protein